MKVSIDNIDLTEAEEIWLRELHLAKFQQVDVKTLRIKLRKNLPLDFDPLELSQKRLVSAGHITLLGIWCIDNSHPIFSVVEKIILGAREYLFQNPTSKNLHADEIAIRLNLDPQAVAIAFLLIRELGEFFCGSSSTMGYLGFTELTFSDDDSSLKKFLAFTGIKRELQTYYAAAPIHMRASESRSRLKKSLTQSSSKDAWEQISKEFEISKQTFGKKMNFVTDKFKRTIIFRDTEHAFVLAKAGFSKPAVILAGGVIEELLRLYLENQNLKPQSDSFWSYITTCEKEGLFKSGINRLSDSLRHFRNLVHLQLEESNRHTLDRAAAHSAVASIFVIIKDLDSSY